MQETLRRSFPRVHFRMNTIVGIILMLSLTLIPASAQTAKTKKTDAQIKQEIITASIAAYRGNCPCPYNRDRAGKSCGARSAYSRPGGAAPLCYERDVTQKTVDDYRKKTGR